MKRSVNNLRAPVALVALVALALLAIPALSIGGGSKTLLDKDSGTGKSAVAVAVANVRDPGRLQAVITSDPRRKPVQWSYTNTCTKNGRVDRWPGPGDHTTMTDRSKIRTSIKMPIQDPDSCSVAVSAKLDYDSGKRVTAKIFNVR
jgi:hypothetical protein